MTTDLRRAIEEIASASPSLHTHATGEHRCTVCLVMIDTAREALGYQPWPAQPKTPLLTRCGDDQCACRSGSPCPKEDKN